MATIDSKRFTKFRLQLELLASHTSYSPEDFVFKYSYNGVVLPTTNYGDIILHEVRYKNGEYFWIEYYIGNVRLLDRYNITEGGELECKGAYRINKFFVENLVDYKYLKSDSIKNFKLISHYTDVVYSDKDTEVAYY